MAVQKTEHEKQVKQTLSTFDAAYDNADEVLEAAAGVVICPKVKKIGFGVGLERGVCSLQVDGETIDHYRISGASFGLIAGIQNNSIMMTFNTQEAFDKFRNKDKGWELGVDATVSVATVGVGGTNLDLGIIRKSPVTTFVVDRSGLMADLSLEGSRFKKVTLPEDAKGDLFSVVAIAQVGSDQTTGGTTRISIGVDQWTDGEARAAVYEALGTGGEAAAMKMISDLPPCGVVKHVGKSEGVPLRWCAAYRAPGGEFRVTVGTTEALGFGAVMQAAKKEDQVVSQFRMMVDAHLEGDGVMVVGADYEWDEGALQVSVKKGSYDPIKLSSVTAYDER
jgi:lipid-binding SYLF domain-containing protein